MLNELGKYPVESHEHIYEFPPLLFRKLGGKSNHTSIPLWTIWIEVHYYELCHLPPKCCEMYVAQWFKACKCWNSTCFQWPMRIWTMLESVWIRKEEKGPLDYSILTLWHWVSRQCIFWLNILSVWLTEPILAIP